MCVCLSWGGSLVSLLNIKQLEVIKYLGRAGSLWILIQPFFLMPLKSPSYFFSLPSFSVPRRRSQSPSLLPQCHISSHVLSSFAALVKTLCNSLITVFLTLFTRELQLFNWDVLALNVMEGREEVTSCCVMSPGAGAASRVHHTPAFFVSNVNVRFAFWARSTPELLKWLCSNFQD